MRLFSRGVGRSIVLTSALVTACATRVTGTGSDRSTPPELDAGTPSGRAAGSNIARDAGSNTERDAGSKAAHDAAPPPIDTTTCPRASAPRADGGSTSPASPASDGAAPPAICVAPCVWDIVKECPPPPACTHQDYGKGRLGADIGLACAPESDWWNVQSASVVATHHHDTSVYSGGRFCYSVSIGLVPVAGPSIVTWRDGAQNGAMLTGPVGTGGYRSGRVYCQAAPPDCSTNAECDALGLRYYDVDTTLPECKPWASVIDALYGQPRCTDGCCPTNPPAIPMNDLPPSM